jgi:hypothetical protein
MGVLKQGNNLGGVVKQITDGEFYAVYSKQVIIFFNITLTNNRSLTVLI